MKRLLNSVLPFILIGIAIVAFAFGIMLLAYLFFFGAIIGFILFIFHWLKQKFFPPKAVSHPEKKAGRIIDSDEWRKL